MIEKHLKLKTMNAITREDLANFISDSTALAFLSASGSGTDWGFLGFETFEDENGEYKNNNHICFYDLCVIAVVESHLNN